MRQYFLIVLLFLAPLHAHAKEDNAIDLPASLQRAPAETMGTLVGTIGYRNDQGRAYDFAALVFRKIDTTDQGRIKYVHPWLGIGGNTGDLEDGNGKFKYASFSVTLPEGRYELIRAISSFGSPSVTNDMWSTEEFSVPFDIERGKVLYLGSFLAHKTVEKSRLGIPVPSLGYFSWANKWSRDLHTLAPYLGSTDPSDVKHAQLDVNERANWFIFAEDHVLETKWKMGDYSAGRTTHAAKIASYQATHPRAID
jgi:hypothetical protein